MEPTLRALATADIPDWNRLLAAVEAVDRTGEHYNEEDLLEEMSNPDIEIGKDIVGAYAGDEMVGYFAVYPRSATGDYHKVALEGAVHPAWRGRGIGSRLVRAMMDRASAAHEERHPDLAAMYSLLGPADNTDQARLLSDVGLVPDRWTFTMRADLAEVEQPGAVPHGFELVMYHPSMSQRLLDAHNTAFLDHPHFTPWTEGMWRQWVTGSRNFRPDLSFLLLDRSASAAGDTGGVIASYLQTNEYDATLAATGRREAFVAKVGSLRGYRGRGLASFLLRHSLAAYRAAGYDEAALDVDSENPTGALGIYQRAGFAVERRWADYVRNVPARGPGLT